MSHNIGTLKELRAEKAKLEREMIIARQYLDVKLEQTFHKGKQVVGAKSSWPLAISSLAAFGVQQLAPNTLAHQYTAPATPFSIADGVQEGIIAMQKPGKEKWYAMIPLALRLLDHWLSTATNEPKQHLQNENYPPQKSTSTVAP